MHSLEHNENEVTVTGPYDAKAVANGFLTRSFDDGCPLDPMKLQKLIYFSHGYYLAATSLRTGKPLPLVDEFFEAWPYGPVLPSVYREFKEFGRSNINRPALSFNPSFRANVVAQAPTGDEYLKEVGDYVWATYATKRAMMLSDITHKRGGAWDRARSEANGLRGKDIPNDFILQDFRSLVKDKAS